MTLPSYVSHETFTSFLAERCSSLEISLSAGQLSKMYEFYRILFSWNSVHNLTTVINFPEIIDRHFIDSLFLLKCGLDFSAGISFADIGSGGGFPGIPLSICLPASSFLLIERIRKKASFLQVAKGTVLLSNISVFCGDAVAADGMFDCIIMRAVTPEPKLLHALTARLSPVGVFAIYHSVDQDLCSDFICSTFSFERSGHKTCISLLSPRG